LNYDAEIVSTLMKVYDSVADIVGAVKVKIGNRRFWNAMFSYLELNEKQSRDAFILIDKRDKMSDFMDGMIEAVGEKAAKEIDSVFTNGYRSFVGKSIDLDNAISEMDRFMELLNSMGVKNAEIDVSIMRGHSYYTGIVFEFFSIDYPELPAVGGGGRYENLVSKFSKTKIVGVGASIGVSRLLVALMESGKIDLSKFESGVDAAVLVMGDENIPYAMSVLNAFRDAGVASLAYLDTDKKFKNQIEYADKIKAKYSVIIGENEAKDKVVTVKNMITGDQAQLGVADAIKLVQGR